MDFSPRSGFQVSQSTATVIAERCAALAAGGALTPEQLVADAADPRSPTHHLFEWDDAKAGHQYRLDQARYYIRSLEVTFRGDKVRAFVSAAPLLDGYVSIQIAASNAAVLEQLRRSALTQLKSWSRSYSQYQSLSSAARHVAQAIAELEMAEQATV